jgi:ribosomal protein S18 acetylase RimI-like enzyme
MRIRELRPGESRPDKLVYRYKTRSHYAVSVESDKSGWSVQLRIKPFPKEIEKSPEGRLFEYHVGDSRVFVASVGREDVGWIEVALQSWNNRLRVWNMIVKEGFRRRGIGSALMSRAKAVAKERDVRMVVLETQSCNVSAIEFYKSQGFRLIGFDACAYSNDDVKRGEVRMEFGVEVEGRRSPKR